MASTTITVCKFVGTISLGLLTGVSTTLSTLTLPSLLTLPTALTARSTLSHLTSRSKTLTTYLRHITTFSLVSAYLLSPRKFRHPYLLYTAIFTAVSGPGVDAAVKWKEARDKKGPRGLLDGEVDLEGQEDVNGERVRVAVERMRVAEGVRAVVAGAAFVMEVVGIWGDGA